LPTPEGNDEQVHVLEVEAPARSRMPMILGLGGMLLVAAAGVWLWLNPPDFGGGGTAAAPKAAGDNLLADAWSFETTDTTSANRSWMVPDEAPGGFSFRTSGAVSGELGAVAQTRDAGVEEEDGAAAPPDTAMSWSRILSDHAVPLGAHRGAVSLAATSASPDIQLLLRFESAGRASLDVVVASGEGRIEGEAQIPPGMTHVRAGLGCVGAGSADDLVLRFVEGSGGGSRPHGGFELLQTGSTLLVFRGDELVMTTRGLTARDADGLMLPPTAASLPGEQAIALPDGTRIRRASEMSEDELRVTLRETLTEIPSGATLVRSVVVSGSLAETPIGMVATSGLQQFSGDFRVEGVSALVLGSTSDRLVLEFGGDTTLIGTHRPDGTVLVRSEVAPDSAGSGGSSFTQELVLQTSFQDERVAAAQHRDAAVLAERLGRLGEALAEVEIVATRYPHDEAVLAAAQAVRARVEATMQARLDSIDRDLEDALFLASAARCREVLADCVNAAGTFAGSEAEARFRERADTVARRAADLLEEDRARRAARLEAVVSSFREAGGYDSVADEIEAYVEQHLQPQGGQPAEELP